MANGQSGLGEQALSKALEVGLSAQLDESETITAEVQADPFSLMQGELKSVDIEGHGLVMQDDLRTEHMKVKTNGIAIDPFKAAFGEIVLTRPTHATVEVMLTEPDINRAFNSDFIADKLQQVAIELNDQTVHARPQKINFTLPGAGTMELVADVTVVETGEAHQVAFKAVPTVGANGYQVVLQDVQTQSEGASESLTNALLEVVSELLDLRNFSLDGMELRLQAIDVQPGRMTLKSQTTLEKFPGS